MAKKKVKVKTASDLGAMKTHLSEPEPRVEPEPPTWIGKPELPESMPVELLARATKLGITTEQIRSLGTAGNLKAYCDQASPQTNPDAMVKADIRPAVEVNAQGVPATIDVAKDDVNAEKQTIERVVRKLNIKHNNPKISTITKTVVYDCQSKKIVSAAYKVER